MNNKDFSIIIYNNDSDHLEECLKYIKAQNYDFNKVEIIIETEQDNLKQIQSNDCIIRTCSGFNAADCYNDALKIANGKYLSFINSSILFKNKNTLKIIDKKMSAAKLLSCNMWYYDIDEQLYKEYRLSNDKNRLIDLNDNYEMINTCLESYFIHNSLVSDIRFDSKFDIEAREKFVVDLYLKNKTYYNLGKLNIVSITPFEDNTSKCSIQYNIDWYNKSLINWNTYLKKMKDVPLYVQEVVFYLIFAKYNCNTNDRNKNVLNIEEREKFINNTKDILKYIDDKIILQTVLEDELNTNAFSVSTSLKMYFYRLKNQSKEAKYFVDNNLLCDSNGVVLTNLDNQKVNVYAINYRKGKLFFDCTVGIADFIKNENINIKVVYGSDKCDITRSYIYNDIKAFGKVFEQKYTFKFNIDVNKYEDLQVFFLLNGEEYPLKFNFVKVQARLNKSKRSYWNYKHFVVRNKLDKLTIRKRNCLKTCIFEICFVLSKLKNERDKLRVVKLSFLRMLYYLTKPFYKNKHIWITFDKTYKAGDNGEYIYHYGLTRGKNIYYIVRDDSVDYNRLVLENKKHILKFNSLRAKLYALHSEVILDTHANAISYCGFDGLSRGLISGLFNPEIICIQHGLSMQDLTQFQNRLFDNIKLYCCASKYEIENLSKKEYDYEENQLKLTGLARYDGLKSNDQRFILITPTWRRNVVNSSVAHSKKKHNENFKNSDYFKIYNSLINNEDLINCAKKNKYKIIYLLHPAMSAQLEDFDKNDYVDIVPATGDLNYEKTLTEASLMVTDYSGVQYDFGYQRKTLIYYHPDKLPPHYNVGMMDYQKMGFGPVCTNEKDLVKELCKSMDNDCKIPKKYKDRADDFFAFSDFDNCKRIIDEVDKYMNNI